MFLTSTDQAAAAAAAARIVLTEVSDIDPHAQMRSRTHHQLGDPTSGPQKELAIYDIYVSCLGTSYLGVYPLLNPRELIQLSLGKSEKETRYFKWKFRRIWASRNCHLGLLAFICSP